MAVLVILLFAAPSSARIRASCLPNTALTVPNQLIINGKLQTLKIGAGPRHIDRVLAHMLRLVINDFFGYQNVTVLNFEYTNVEWVTEMDCGINFACDDVALIHAGLLEPVQYSLISKNSVKSAGLLGPSLRTGWFVSRGPNRPKIHQYYRNFRNPTFVRNFFVDQEVLEELTWRDSSKKLRWCDDRGGYVCDPTGIFTPTACRAQKCATIFAAYPHESHHILVTQIIGNRLLVRVAWIGDQFDEFISAQLEKDTDVLFHDLGNSRLITNRSAVTEVLFRTCNMLGNPNGCVLQPFVMRKLYWDGLEHAAPEVVKLMKNLRINNNWYESIYGEYRRNLALDEDSVSNLACSVLARSTQLRNRWLYKVNFYPKLKILMIRSARTSALSNVTGLAVDIVNRQLFQGLVIEQTVIDGKCNREVVLQEYLSAISMKGGDDDSDDGQIVAVLAPDCNQSLEGLIEVAGNYQHIVIAYMTSMLYSDLTETPDFLFRIHPDTTILSSAYVDFFSNRKWRNFAVLTDLGHQSPWYITNLNTMAQIKDQKFHGPFRFRSVEDLQHSFDQIKKNPQAKIIIGDFPEYRARNIMCEAFRSQVTARQGFVWILPPWIHDHWYRDVRRDDPSPDACRASEILEAIDYSFTYRFKQFADDDFNMDIGTNVSVWRQHIPKRMDGATIDNSGFAFDAVWALASSLKKLLGQNEAFTQDLRDPRRRRRALTEWIRTIKSNSFHGASGAMQFEDNIRRANNVTLFQTVDGIPRSVGYFETEKEAIAYGTNQYSMRVFDDKIRWFSGKQPGDGTPFCQFELLAQFAGVSCDVAKILVVVAVLLVVIVLTGIVSAVAFWRHFTKRVESLTQSSAVAGLELPEDSIRIYRLIGEGAFGRVYSGQFVEREKHVITVAVKAVKKISDLNARVELLREACVMKQFKHVNLLQIVGVITAQDKCQIVMEFMMYGNLKAYLQDRKHLLNQNISGPLQLTKMALDISRGLAYLASLNYIHGDLACRNCLVHETLTVKIADFGFCRNADDPGQSLSVRGGPMPVRWMSPELLRDGLHSTASDVWSFGITLYEIITFGVSPYQGMDDEKVHEFIKDGGHPKFPDGISEQLKRLFLRIWTPRREGRLSAMEIFEILLEAPELVHPCPEKVIAITRSGYMERR